jgi:hypothetical protein
VVASQVGKSLDPAAGIKALGGKERAARSLALYYRLPARFAPYKETSIMLLAECGKNAMPALTAALSDRDPATRLAAARALRMIGPDAHAAAEALRRAAGDSSPEVRQAAAEALHCLPYLGLKPDELSGPSVFTVGVPFWTVAPSLLFRNWLLVVGGTVVCRRVEPSSLGAGIYVYPGGVLVERVLCAERGRKELRDWNEGTTYLALTDGLEGFKAGDKVIIFANGYNGDVAIQPVTGGNCRVGIKVDSWDDPIVAAVEKLCRAKDRREALKDAEVQRAWRRFDDSGVEAILRGVSHFEILEERGKR